MDPNALWSGGATSAIDPAADIHIDAAIAFDCIGAGESANTAIRLTRKGGRIVLVGIFNSLPHTNLNELVLREREMVGSFAYVDDFPGAIQLVADG